MTSRFFWPMAVCAMPAIAACGAEPRGSNASPEGVRVMGALDMTAVHESEERAAERRDPTPAIRRPFLSGYFETRSSEFPVEVEQAMSGARPERTVIVWAGRDNPRPVKSAPSRR